MGGEWRCRWWVVNGGAGSGRTPLPPDTAQVVDDLAAMYMFQLDI